MARPKTAARKTAKRKPRSAPVMQIVHAGPGELVRTRVGVELRLYSSRAQALTAGVSRAVANRLFRYKMYPPPPPLCAVIYTPEKGGLDDYIAPPTLVRCVDQGCSKKANCVCSMYSVRRTVPPGGNPDFRPESGKVYMEEDRLYYCDCTEVFSD